MLAAHLRCLIAGRSRRSRPRLEHAVTNHHPGPSTGHHDGTVFIEGTGKRHKGGNHVCSFETG